MSLEGTTSRWIDDLDPDDEEERDRTSRGWRPRLLLVAASIPWLIVVTLLVVPTRIGGDAEPPSSDAATPEVPVELDERTVGDDEPDPAASPPVNGSSSPPDMPAELELTEVRGAWRVEPGPEEAAALGIVIARAWLTSLDPLLEVEGLSTPAGHRYAEHLVVEAVERTTADVAVVTVLAIVLQGEETLEAQVRRLAVPMVWDDHGHPRPAGPPWDLPAPELATVELATSEPMDPDAEDAALAALHAAGYLDVELHGVHSSEPGPVIAQVQARTADGVEIDGQVWLRRHVDGFVVAGTTSAGSEAP